MVYADTNTRCLVLRKIDTELPQRRRMIYALALKYNEDVEYIERLITFFSGSFFALPTTEQKERLEKHLQNKTDELYHQRVSRKWNGNITLITGRSNDNG